MATKRRKSKHTSHYRASKRPVPRSPNIVMERKLRIEGKPAVERIYRKRGTTDQYVATIHVGVTQMHNKRPRMGKKISKKKRRR